MAICADFVVFDCLDPSNPRFWGVGTRSEWALLFLILSIISFSLAGDPGQVSGRLSKSIRSGYAILSKYRTLTSWPRLSCHRMTTSRSNIETIDQADIEPTIEPNVERSFESNIWCLSRLTKARPGRLATSRTIPTDITYRWITHGWNKVNGIGYNLGFLSSRLMKRIRLGMISGSLPSMLRWLHSYYMGRYLSITLPTEAHSCQSYYCLRQMVRSRIMYICSRGEHGKPTE
jgi:hypothetical protein